MLYNLFLVLHVFCASMVLSLLPFTFLMRGKRNRSKGTPVELYTIQTEFSTGRFMGMAGGIGLLIAGAGMAGIAKMPWFDFVGFQWLAIKQVLYILILALNFSMLMPIAKKIMPLIAQQMSKGNVGATDEIRALANKATVIAIIMSLLGLANAVLGLTWRIRF